jgi:hypothetical protein
MKLKQIIYEELNSRQKKYYNYQKVASILADYGFLSIRVSDEGEGADFNAAHIDGKEGLKIQLKGRAIFDKKYLKKDFYICFPDGKDWYMYPHDEVLDIIIESGKMVGTRSWDEDGSYSFPSLSTELIKIFANYRL